MTEKEEQLAATGYRPRSRRYWNRFDAKDRAAWLRQHGNRAQIVRVAPMNHEMGRDRYIVYGKRKTKKQAA